MATSTLRIPPDTEQVRVARLVAGTAARRAGVAEDDVEDVRLAVGEAVGRAVVRHREEQLRAPVMIEFRDDSHVFQVEVTDAAGDASPDNSFALAVITGLVPAAEVKQHSVIMAWSV